mmetsp:Transcript_24639/g.36521  ORF Transcript_24639/g.36521 Transcript_24639/m.36521 type:complete len:100 (-) Transcript_24639:3606-3905(-)
MRSMVNGEISVGEKVDSVLVTAVRPGCMAQLVRVVSRETMGRTNTKKLTTVVCANQEGIKQESVRSSYYFSGLLEIAQNVNDTTLDDVSIVCMHWLKVK